MKFLAGAVAGVLGGAALAVGAQQLADRPNVASQLPPMDTSQPPRVQPSDGLRTLSYAGIVKTAAPAVVNVFTATIEKRQNTLMDDPFFRQFFGGGAPQPRVQQSLGSGVVVGADGLIITNNHVVAGADQIVVSLADRREFKAKILFADPRLDLALLKVDTGGASLPVIRMADSDRV
jgi:serine protease Do